jgi:outer membrane assembly lipoprotein YfiO
MFSLNSVTNFKVQTVLNKKIASTLYLIPCLVKTCFLGAVNLCAMTAISFSIIEAVDSIESKNESFAYITKNVKYKTSAKKQISKKTIDNEQDLYKLGLEYCNKGIYRKAIKCFNDYYLKKPLSDEGFLAMIMEAYCLYQQNKFLASINAIDDILLIRSDKESDANFVYAKYLKILAYIQTYLSPAHSLQSMLDAKKQCLEFLKNHKTSRYSKQIKETFIPIIEKRIVAKDMYVGIHYLNNQNAPGAANRFLSVLNNNVNKYTAEALYGLMRAYCSLGLYDDAIDRFKKYANLIVYKSDKEKNFWNKKYSHVCNKYLNENDVQCVEKQLKKLPVQAQ